MITMGFRSGVIIGFSLLTIVIGTFLLLGMTGGTMQRVSLAAFILAMGMLVDNAIVIVDGILVDLKLGKPRREAMCAIGRKTAMPLLGATVIAILAFLPDQYSLAECKTISLQDNWKSGFCAEIFQCFLRIIKILICRCGNIVFFHQIF